ncbi:S8 family serine peptidase [Streptomyces sp. Je 1-79]|uniref:S8 family serine peptidase n=1 Tax=Streptomyces sp. Je 1-79 TaxID=2943847 RepID=UPI0021A62E20|nr:S8 family serine peptidase [Streptomyces sp. Je 1-79]MCT4354063.1 S8 family serine peptidase [Streptomyces sp. Je 1-79]
MIQGRTLRRGLLSTVTAAVLTAGLVGVAPTAVAADARSKQWYLDAMKAEEAWKTSTGAGIKVAVIDSGVNPSTASLKGKVLKGLDVAEAKGDETDDYRGHGTTMAELIVGSGAGGGLKGLAPDAKVIPYRVSDTELQNNQRVNAFDMEEAIRAAADSDAQIINISFASEYYSSDVRKAVKYAQQKGKLLFAGAGNSGDKDNKPQYPASYPEAIAVAATTKDGEWAKYSQHGDYVDLAAPGSEIPGWCDEKFKSYCATEGTSNATAIASASAALIWSAHPDWTGNQVLRVMLDSAARGDDWEPGTLSRYLGHGVVRPNAHLTRGVGKPGDPGISPLTNEKVGGEPGSSGSSPSGDASAAPSVSASASGSPQAPETDPSADAVVAGSSKSTDDGSPLGLIIGGAAAVVVVAGVAFVLVRRRRTA